jgi:seryl-tRNA synthetase
MPFSNESLYDDLVAHKLIIPVGVQGIFGRGAVFEDVLARVDALISRVAAADGAEKMMFPPCLDRKVLEKSEYLDSFPHLLMTVSSFFGKELEARKLAEKVRNGEPWGESQKLTDVVLTPAACYPVYPSFTGTVPDEGRLVDMQNWVFRHEPSPEPTRMQAFRVREFVRVGTPEMVVAWRNTWIERGMSLLTSLGLPAREEVAADPFFGRGGALLAVNQKEQKLKFEIVIPVISEEKPTAVCSFNYHTDHFGKLFDIHQKSGALAHTACLGFGMERVCMALFKTHGCVPSAWPKAVRDVLFP